MEDFPLPQDLSPEVIEILSKPEVKDAILKINTPLVEKKNELLGQLSTLKKQINDFGGFETLKTKLSAYDQIEAEKNAAAQQAALASTDVATIKTAYETKLSELTNRIQSMEQEKVNSTVEKQISKAIQESKGISELLTPFIKERIKVTADNGKVNISVLTPDGAPLLTADGKDAGLKDLLQEFKNSSIYSRAFDADNVQGSGSRQSVGPGISVENPFKKDSPHFNVTKQMTLFRQDPQLARQLAAQAGVVI